MTGHLGGEHLYDDQATSAPWVARCTVDIPAAELTFERIGVAKCLLELGPEIGGQHILFGERSGSNYRQAQAEVVRLVGEFLSFDSAARIVHVRITCGLRGAHGGMSFNGAHDGGATITIPLGWSVRARFANADKVPHSVLVVRESSPISAAPDTPAIAGATSTRVASGITAHDAPEELAFTTREARRYRLVCGVPGHAMSGMWIRLVVDAAAERPSYK